MRDEWVREKKYVLTTLEKEKKKKQWKHYENKRGEKEKVNSKFGNNMYIQIKNED